MGNLVRKYISPVLLIVNLLTFVFFTLVSPHVPLTHSFLNVLFFLLLSAPVITLFVLRTVRVKRNPEKAPFFYDRAFNILSLVNNYLFIASLNNITIVTTSVRAPVGYFYIIFFVISWLINIFELMLSLGYLDKVLITRDLSLVMSEEEKTTKDLAREATIKRIEEKTSTFYFFIGLTALLGVIFFIVPLFTEMFTIPLGGDYTQQQIPFYTNGYDDWWHFIKTGQFPLWDSNTFLGVNNIGSNSFYYALNPFFLPILIFPRDLIPQGIAILMIGKFVLAALTMRMYLRYMGVSEKEARIFAIIYAFSGWNTYYLWFNHFMEVAVTFPLIFLGIEKVLKEKKITFLILSLALMGFANYFFLMTVLVIGVLYAGFRYFQMLPKVDPSIIGLGILAFALGILISSVVLLPSLAIALGSDRVTNATYLDNLKAAFEIKNYKLVWEIITKWENQSATYDHKKYYPFITYFFPVLSDRSVALLNTSSYDNTISSLFTFSPVILLFIPALFVSFKKKKVSHFIALIFLGFAVFTPFFYNAFHGFSKEYGRWQLIVTFSLITYVAMSLPAIKEEKPFILDASLIINLILMAATVKVAYSYENRNGFNYMYQREYIIYYQFIMLFITYLFLRFMQKNKFEIYTRSLLVFLELAVMGTVTMFGHGFISYKDNVSGGLQGYNDDLKVIRQVQAFDSSFYRILNTRAYKGNDNLPMRENYNGLTTFHSLYNFELKPFTEWSRIHYDGIGWSLGVMEKRGILNDFLQIKYYVLNDNDSSIRWSDKTMSVAPYRNVPYTYEYRADLSTANRYVYKMKESFEIGFGVDYAVSYERLSASGTKVDEILARGRFASVENEELYLTSALLNYDDHREVIQSTPHLGSLSYSELPRKSYEKLAKPGLLSARYFDFSESGERYPYEADMRGGTKLPTPEFVNEFAKEFTIPFGSDFKLDGAKHAIEYTKTDGTNIINGPGEIILNLPLSRNNYGNNYRYNVFLYDEDYKLITFDSHGTPPSFNTYSKVMRSYHTPKAVKKVTLIPIGSAVSYPPEYELYVYEQAVIDNIRKTSIENTLKDVDVSTNKITFKTDYLTEKFVVTTIPYDEGWKVKTSDNVNLPVYKVQGGFVGFVSGKGEISYTMAFAPKNFNFALLISFSALVITGLLELNVRYYKKYKKRQSEELAKDQELPVIAA
ncbi:MAG: YfhO family protein [Bacilli bacterium]|nr:YfhO family protein [Bacilli bacterium]